MNKSIINWPKGEKKLPVSFTINPVTQVALVAVNKLSIRPGDLPSLVAIGRLKSSVAHKMAARKLNNTT